MGMKAVELQIAVPRTSDAGKIQQEHLIRPSIEQSILADQAKEQTERMRTRSSNVKEAASASIHNGNPGEQHAASRQQHTEEEKEESAVVSAEHPYKGKHIDLSF